MGQAAKAGVMSHRNPWMAIHGFQHHSGEELHGHRKDREYQPQKGTKIAKSEMLEFNPFCAFCAFLWPVNSLLNSSVYPE
jgi:hypothetical protein